MPKQKFGAAADSRATPPSSPAPPPPQSCPIRRAKTERSENSGGRETPPKTTPTMAAGQKWHQNSPHKKRLAPVLIRIEGSEGEQQEGGMEGHRADRGEHQRGEEANDRRNYNGTTAGRPAEQANSSNNSEGGIGVEPQRTSSAGSKQEQLLASFSSIELRNSPILLHRGSSVGVPSSSNAAVTNDSAASTNASSHSRPCSSGEADLQQACFGHACARLRLSVQYSDQKRLLILTVHELMQTDKEQARRDEKMAASPMALQIRLALLTDCPQPGAKVQKFQSKFHSVNQFQEVHYGQTFAFHCDREQLAGSVVRFRLYSKGKGHQHRPQCLGIAFLRNYLVDADAHRAQNHFLQFRANLMEQTKSKAKGTLSLFPSLLSLTSHHSSCASSPVSPGQGQQQQPFSACSSSTKSSISTPPPSAFPLPPSAPATPHHHQQQQQQSPVPMTPQSASSSRRGSTVDVESGRFCSLPQFGSNQPEVLISLCYFDAQNRLVVGVEKVAALGNFGTFGKDEEFFVRISALLPDGTERGKHKSECVRAFGMAETHFNAQAAFHVPRAELDHCSVLVQLYAVHGSVNWPLLLRRKQRIGALTLGGVQHAAEARRKGSNSSGRGGGSSGGNGIPTASADAQTHWREMIQGMGLTVDKWHLLEKTTAATAEAEYSTGIGSSNGQQQQQHRETAGAGTGGGGKLFGGSNFLEAVAK